MIRSLFLSITILLGASSTFAADWPCWGGRDGRNMASDEKNLPESFLPGATDGTRDPAARNIKWTMKLGSMTCSSPVVSGGKVFIGTAEAGHGILLCLEEATGKPLWRWRAPAREVPKQIDGRKVWFNVFPRSLGVCSTPAVDGDRVYFVNQRLEVVCLDTRGAETQPATAAVASTSSQPATSPATRPSLATLPDARVLWTVDMWESCGVRPSDACNGSILVYGDVLYVSTSNGVDRDADARIKDEFRKPPAPNAPTIIALDKNTGRLLATDEAPIGSRLLHGQWSSPSLGKVGDKTLLFYGGGDGFCYAFETLTTLPKDPVKLKTVWSVDCNPVEYKSFGELDLVAHYCRGDRRRSDTINKIADGSFVGMSEIIATPVFYRNRVYVAIGRDPEHGRGRGALWCIDATKTGDITTTGKIWCYQGLDRSLSTVSIADGLLYVSDVAGRLHCLNADTGECYWIHETKATAWGSTLVADGKIYMPTEKSLWILAAGKQKKVLDKILLGAPAWATPVAANGVLYVASTRNLWAVQRQP